MSGRTPSAASRWCDGEPDDAERRLGDPGVGERGALGRRAAVGVEGGRREQRVRPVAAESQVAPQLGEGDEQVGEHPGPLAALPGEQERHLARRGRRLRRSDQPASAGRARRSRAAPAVVRPGRPGRAATIATRTGPAPVGPAAVAPARSRSRHGRPAASFGSSRVDEPRDRPVRRRPVGAAEAGTARPATRRRPCRGLGGRRRARRAPRGSWCRRSRTR